MKFSKLFVAFFLLVISETTRAGEDACAPSSDLHLSANGVTEGKRVAQTSVCESWINLKKRIMLLTQTEVCAT